MQNNIYNIRERRKEKKETEFSFQQLYWTLESLGNNFMAMLWQVHLALKVLQEGDNPDQAKKNLQDALQAGDCARKLMRTILNFPNHIEADRLGEHRKNWKN
jgi:hypothetical protein